MFQDKWADGRKLVMTPKSTGSRKRGKSMRNKRKDENGKNEYPCILKTLKYRSQTLRN
jgi:hypothetical protein